MPIIPILGIDLAASLRGSAGVWGVILRCPRTEFSLSMIKLLLLFANFGCIGRMKDSSSALDSYGSLLSNALLESFTRPIQSGLRSIHPTLKKCKTLPRA